MWLNGITEVRVIQFEIMNNISWLYVIKKNTFSWILVGSDVKNIKVPFN